MQKTVFTFREVSQRDELLTMFALRYYLLKNSEIPNLISSNRWELDIDQYDLYSRHFGIFKNNRILLGSVRLVGPYRGPAYQKIEDLMQEYSLKSGEPRISYPLMEYCQQKERITPFLEGLQNQGKFIVEGSRYLVDKVKDNFRVGIQLVESLNAVSLLSEFPTVMIAATSIAHARGHRRYGFNTIPGSVNFSCEKVNESSLIFAGGGRERYLQSLSENQANRLLKIKSAFDLTGMVCFGGPSNTDDFLHERPSSFYI